jgi:hypothetical protein
LTLDTQVVALQNAPAAQSPSSPQAVPQAPAEQAKPLQLVGASGTQVPAPLHFALAITDAWDASQVGVD